MKHRITFLPDNITVGVDDTADLLKAAKSAGITVLSSCGGKGNCGKCKLMIKEGKVEAGNSKDRKSTV
jgi:uncharacterized 2Fe-2S/4Fe-4S cluster protein (DUF4445 family)